LAVANAGKTWARNLRVKNRRITNPVTPDPFDAVYWGAIETVPMVLAPSQQFNLQFLDVQFAERDAIAEGKLQMFFAAWITYEDVLSQPPIRRQTQLSWKLNADHEGGVAFAWLPTHNCADDDCPKCNPDSSRIGTMPNPLGPLA
jgi:hypothetical protein